MEFREFMKDVSLKNSVIIAVTLNRIFSQVDIFESFADLINISKENKSIQRYVWGKEIDYTTSKLKKIGETKELFSKSNTIKLIDMVKENNKITGYKIISTEDIEISTRQSFRNGKHIYDKGNECVDKIVIQANTETFVSRFDLLRLMCTIEFSGVLKNAKLKMPNAYFKNGIQTPYDLLNKCTLVFDDEAMNKA